MLPVSSPTRIQLQLDAAQGRGIRRHCDLSNRHALESLVLFGVNLIQMGSDVLGGVLVIQWLFQLRKPPSASLCYHYSGYIKITSLIIPSVLQMRSKCVQIRCPCCETLIPSHIVCQAQQLAELLRCAHQQLYPHKIQILKAISRVADVSRDKIGNHVWGYELTTVVVGAGSLVEIGRECQFL